MSDPTCATCQRPDPTGGYACPDCAGRARRSLATIADLTPDARDVAHGQARHGPAVHGGGGGRLPLNLAAASRLDAIQGELTTWVRHVAAERGLPLPPGRDPLAVSARWLTGHVEWLRYRAEGGESFAAIATCARVITGIVDRPGERRWLGTCEAPTDHGPCPAELHARVGATKATCRGCGAEHNVSERRDWLDETARSYSYTATEIEQAYGVKAGKIRVWAHRKRIAATGEVDGRPIYPLGAVLKLAADDAGRRATEQARRKRRAEQRAREDDGTRPEGEAA